MLDRTAKSITRARHLRQVATKSEELFWQRVRNGQIGGHKIRRQVPLGGLVVDFACVSARLVIEIDGGVHNEPDVQARDAQRHARLNALGYRVLRFGDGAVYHDLEAVVWVIEQKLNE